MNEVQLKLDLYFEIKPSRKKMIKGLNKILKPPCCLGLKKNN
jgi:hypothetical protein